MGLYIWREDLLKLSKWNVHNVPIWCQITVIWGIDVPDYWDLQCHGGCLNVSRVQQNYEFHVFHTSLGAPKTRPSVSGRTIVHEYGQKKKVKNQKTLLPIAFSHWPVASAKVWGSNRSPVCPRNGIAGSFFLMRLAPFIMLERS